jgi:hypothetical protein
VAFAVLADVAADLVVAALVGVLVTQAAEDLHGEDVGDDLVKGTQDG